MNANFNLTATDDENISQIVDNAEGGIVTGIIMDTRHLNNHWTISMNGFADGKMYLLHKSKAEDVSSAFQCWENGDADEVVMPKIIDLTRV